MENYYGKVWQDQETGATLPLTKVNSFLQRVFFIMTAGLAITGLTAYGFADYLVSNPQAIVTIFGSPLRYVVMFLPFAFVLALSFGINRMSYATATLVFGGYALAMGISLSSIFLVYEMGSIATTFFVTAGTFGAMALVGLTTKADLTKLGTYLMMGLIGLIIASLVNLFIGSDTFSFIISIVGVLIFTGLTAYDVQKIVRVSVIENQGDMEAAQKASLIGALSLYLDFINLFLFLLRLLGSNRN